MVIQVLTNKAFCNDGNILDTSVLVQYGNHQSYVATENMKHD